jgi:hypothetical protein
MPEIYNVEKEMNKVKRGIEVAKDGSQITPEEAKARRKKSLDDGSAEQE